MSTEYGRPAGIYGTTHIDRQGEGHHTSECGWRCCPKDPVFEDVTDKAPVPAVAEPGDDQLRKNALSLYSPPFTYDGNGYVWDSASNMVADFGDVDQQERLASMMALRVRGWGRIGYETDGEALQDKVGELIAEALTEFWVKKLTINQAREKYGHPPLPGGKS